MKVFATDLDGTVIYSQNHEFVSQKKLVETHKDYTAYMNANLYEHLPEYNSIVPFVPITTRSLEEYSRIKLPIIPEYALILNGAMLLKNGVVDASWTNESRSMIQNEIDELEKTKLLINAINTKGEFPTTMFRERNGFFIFLKTNYVSETMKILKENLDLDKVDIYGKKSKIYIVPKSLNKGVALKRLKQLLNIDYVISAGDSDMDSPMLVLADKIIPCEYLKEKGKYINE